MKKQEIYDELTDKKISLGLINAERKRYKEMIRAIDTLGSFNGKMYAKKHTSTSEFFLDSLCITDSDGVEFYLTPASALKDQEKWLDKKSTNSIIAKKESENIYSLYEPMTSTPEKIANIFLINDAILYVHNNMVFQYYDYIRNNKKMSIKLEKRARLLSEYYHTLTEELEKNDPQNLIQYLNILFNITDLYNCEVLEANTLKNNQKIEDIKLKKGVIKEMSLIGLSQKQLDEIEMANKITITDLYDYKQKEDSPEYEINLDIVKIDKNCYSIIETINQNHKTRADVYVMGNKLVSTIYNHNQVTYSVQDKDNNLELTISNEKETRKNEQKFINGIRDKNHTNTIELLKVADDSGLLKDNHSFVATSENETIRMENDELVEYIIPDDVYEKTKNEITYEMPTTDSYEKHPEAFQLTKKVTK